MLAAFVTKPFSSDAVALGNRLREEGAVQVSGSRKGDTGFLSANVIVESFCALTRIEWNRAEMQQQCNCLSFRNGEKCEHLYALLLEADARKLLPLTFLASRPPEKAMPDWAADLERVASQWTDEGDNEGDLPTGAINYLVSPMPETSEESGLLVRIADGTGNILALAPLDAPRLSEAADRQIITLLAGVGNMDEYSGYDKHKEGFKLYTPAIATALPAICATGRAHWSAGNERPVPLKWDGGGFWIVSVEISGGEELHCRCVLRRGEETRNAGDVTMLSDAGLFVARGEVSPVRGPINPKLLDRMASPITVPRAQAELLLRQLAAIPGGHELRWPEDLGIGRATPRCMPVLQCALVTTRSQWITEDVVTCDLEFSYEGVSISARDRAPAVFDAKSKRLVFRDLALERDFAGQLPELGFRYRFISAQMRKLLIPASRFREVAFELAEEGWQIEGDGLPRYVQGADLELQVKSGIDWLEVTGEVQFGDAKVKLPELLKAVRKGERFIDLPGGRKGVIPVAALKPIAALASAVAGESEDLRFAPSQAALIDALISTTPGAITDERFDAMRQAFEEAAHLTAAEPPVGFVGELRHYQKDALAWFAFLRKYQLGGCLADDMGLGKTVQVLAMLEDRRQQRHTGKVAGPRCSLVVAPRSLVFNWVSEAAKFTPMLNVLDYGRAERSLDELDNYDLAITTYGTLRRDALELARRKFDYVILDEAQAIKNAQTATARAARVLEGSHRLALSGTPVENHLGELVSIFEFLNPRMLSAGPLADGRAMDPDFAKLLARALRPFILRRTKQQVAPELPERTEQTIFVELDEDERKNYNELRQYYQRLILGEIDRSGVNKNRFQVLEALLRLRQAACHPGLIQSGRADQSSSKLESILEELDEVIDEGHKALVFSQFVGMLSIVRRRLDQRGIDYEYLDGATADRQQHVERFQSDGGCKLFLISLKAGGVGLNLTAAEYVFLLDPWWNPAAEAQAIDRAHRIGQTRQVFAYRLITKDTVEEKVLELQNRKRDLADAIIGEQEGPLASLTRQDVELLLS